MSTTNPFALGYEALWTCLEAREEFTDLVLSNNRIKFTSTARDPWERLANCRSYPAVAIVPVANPRSTSRIQSDSHTTDVDKWFGIFVATGDQRLADVFDVQFAILRAMVNWRTAIGAVEWNSRDCVLDCSVFEHPEELDKQLSDRGIRGWSCEWAGRIWYQFVTSELAATDSSSSGA